MDKKRVRGGKEAEPGVYDLSLVSFLSGVQGLGEKGKMNSCIKSKGPGTDNGGVAFRSEPAQRDTHWQGPASGHYPHGSKAVTNLRRAEVLGKPLNVRKLENVATCQLSPKSLGTEGPVGTCLKSVFHLAGGMQGPLIYLGDGCHTEQPPSSLLLAMPSMGGWEGGAGPMAVVWV